MAHIETHQTGDRVVTVVRGRQMRNGSSLPKFTRKKAKERRLVCVLNTHAGQLLEHWGVSQACFGDKCQHEHQSRDAVAQLVRDGILRWLPGGNGNVAAYSYGRTWKGVPSGPVKVMQLVEG